MNYEKDIPDDYIKQNERVKKFLLGIRPILMYEGYAGLVENCDELMDHFKKLDKSKKIG